MNNILLVVMLRISLRVRMPNEVIRQRTCVEDAIRTILTLKWNGTDGTWTKKILEWRPQRNALRKAYVLQRTLADR